MIRVLRLLPALLLVASLLAFYFWLSPIHFGPDIRSTSNIQHDRDIDVENLKPLNCVLHYASIPKNSEAALLANLTDTPKPLAETDSKKIRTQFKLAQSKITIDKPPLYNNSVNAEIPISLRIGSQFVAFNMVFWNPFENRFDCSISFISQNSAVLLFTQRQSDSIPQLEVSTRFYEHPFELIHPHIPPPLVKYTQSFPIYKEVTRVCPANTPQTFAWILPDPTNDNLLLILDLNPPPSLLKILLTSPIFPLP